MKLLHILLILSFMLPGAVWGIVDPGGAGGGSGGDSGDTDTGGDATDDVHKITIKSDKPWRVTYPEYVFYVKYNAGFANSEFGLGNSVSGGTWLPAQKNISNIITAFEPYVHSYYDLTGYYHNEKKYLEADGAWNSNLTNTAFSGDATLMAGWQPKDYTVEYHCKGYNTDSPVERTCTYDTPCYVQSFDSVFTGNSCVVPDGKLFGGFYCYDCSKMSDGATVCGQCAQLDWEEKLQAGARLYEWGRNHMPQYKPNEYDIVPFWVDCPAGYYCNGGKQNPCPVGTTSNTGSSVREDCYYAGGASGTKFCDKHGCFNLPDGVVIPVK